MRTDPVIPRNPINWLPKIPKSGLELFRSGVLLPGSFLAAAALSIYLLAFVITPYWRLFPSTSTRWLALSVFLVAGIGWSILSSSQLQLRIDVRQFLGWALLLGIMLLLNFRPLLSDIPWRGDEDFHISRVMAAAGQILDLKQWVVAGAAFFLAFWVLAWKKSAWAKYAAAFLILSIVFIIQDKGLYQAADAEFLLRYPFLSYWLAAVGPAVASLFSTPYEEYLYRIVPFLSSVALVWTIQSAFSSQKMAIKLLVGICAASLPLVLYYSSIFYLEMPAIFLMTVVCLQVSDLLQKEPSQVRQSSGWYCLILVGLIKETTLPFLAAFLFIRWLVQFRRRKHELLPGKPRDAGALRDRIPLWLKAIGAELRIAFGVLFPAVLYLALRAGFTASRGYNFDLQNLFQPLAYAAMGRSFWDQFGVFGLCFLAGCGLLLRRKEWTTALFFLSLVLGYQLFFLFDYWALVGYSRFNLLILPPVLGGTVVFLRWVLEKSKALGIGLVVVSILIHLLISPINLDGSKKPLWGTYNSDTAEHYYPYREAISWMKETYPGARILSGGLYYGYAFDFYSHKYDWFIDDVLYTKYRPMTLESDSAALAGALSEAGKRDYPLVLFHILGQEVPPMTGQTGYVQEKVFRNDSHLLVVYRRASSQTGSEAGSR